MTRLIGLGSSCIVAQRLRIAQLSQETHMFDWITSTFQTVLNVLRCVNAQDFVNKLMTNIEFKSEPFEGNRVIHCPQLGKFESYHDLPYDFDESLFQEHFVNKYLRRYVRFMQVVSNSESFVFVHWISKNDPCIREEDINEFFNNVYAINSNKKVHLALIHENHKEIPNYHRNNIQCYQLNDYEKESAKSNDWQLNHIDWDRLLKEINEIL